MRWCDTRSALRWRAGPSGGSETCYSYSPKLTDENEEISDLLIGLPEARKTLDFKLCFLILLIYRPQGASRLK